MKPDDVDDETLCLHCRAPKADHRARNLACPVPEARRGVYSDETTFEPAVAQDDLPRI